MCVPKGNVAEGVARAASRASVGYFQNGGTSPPRDTPAHSGGGIICYFANNPEEEAAGNEQPQAATEADPDPPAPNAKDDVVCPTLLILPRARGEGEIDQDAEEPAGKRGALRGGGPPPQRGREAWESVNDRGGTEAEGGNREEEREEEEIAGDGLGGRGGDQTQVNPLIPVAASEGDGQ